MSKVNSLHHIVISTYQRKPALASQYSGSLYKYICGILNTYKCRTLAIGGIEDHIHLLVAIHQDMAVSVLLRELKRSTSMWIQNHRIEFPQFLGWNEGYYAASVSHSHRDSVMNYINNQSEHHKIMSPREELIRFLDRNGIDYDIKFIN